MVLRQPSRDIAAELKKNKKRIPPTIKRRTSCQQSEDA